MSGIHCHRCGCPLADGSDKYEVAVHVRSLFDGTVPDNDGEAGNFSLHRLLEEVSDSSEEDLNRQVYEDDVFIMCPPCKEAFLEEIYSRLRPEATPEHGRAHLIH